MNSRALVGIGALLLGGVGGYMGGNSESVDADAAEEARVASKSSRTAVTSGGGEGRASKGANFEDIMREPGQTARL